MYGKKQGKSLGKGGLSVKTPATMVSKKGLRGK